MLKAVENFWSVLGLAGFCLILLAVMLAVSSPCAGYELSIYTNTPLTVWIFLIMAYISGLSIVTYALDHERSAEAIPLGYSILLLTNFTVMLLPTLRGYFLYGTADTLNHLSKIMDILSYGTFSQDPPSNIYPVTHTLISQLVIVTSIPLMDLALWFGPLLSTLFIAFIYILARSVSHSRKMFILSVASSFVFIFNYFHAIVYPELVSFYLLPLILYIYFRSLEQRDRTFRLSLIILLIYLVFVYPPTLYVLVFSLLILDIIRGLHNGSKGFSFVKNISLNLFLISFASLYEWASKFEVFGATIRHTALTLQGSPPHFLVRAQANTRGIGILDAVEYFFKMIGDDAIWLVLALVAIIIFIRKRHSIKQDLFLLGIFFLTAEPFYASLFIARFKSISRLIFISPVYAIISILVGFSFYEFYRRRPVKRVKVLILFVIVATWLISVLGLYHSPYVLQPSLQITRMDSDGTKWFFKYRNPDLTLRAMGFPVSLQNIALGDREVMLMEYNASFILGTNAWPEWDGNPLVPKYIGYITIGHKYWIGPNIYLINETSPNYLVLTSRYLLASGDPTLSKRGIADRSLYAKNIDIQVVYKIRNDPATQIIYSNGEYDLHYILLWENVDNFLRAAIRNETGP